MNFVGRYTPDQNEIYIKIIDSFLIHNLKTVLVLTVVFLSFKRMLKDILCIRFI